MQTANYLTRGGLIEIHLEVLMHGAAIDCSSIQTDHLVPIMIHLH
jgi:hypothetical protein